MWLVFLVLVVLVIIIVIQANRKKQGFKGNNLSTNNIKSVLLRSIDVPRGFTLMGRLEENTNQLMARDFRNPDAKLKLFEQYGRITGYDLRFDRYSGRQNEESVISGVVLYKDASGAEFLNKDWKADLMMRAENESAKMGPVEEITIPQIGEASWAFRCTLSVKTPSGYETGNFIAIQWRRSNIVSRLSWGSKGTNVFQTELLSLVQKQDARVISYLQNNKT
jgi:hypothetical protein